MRSSLDFRYIAGKLALLFLRADRSYGGDTGPLCVTNWPVQVNSSGLGDWVNWIAFNVLRAHKDSICTTGGLINFTRQQNASGKKYVQGGYKKRCDSVEIKCSNVYSNRTIKFKDDNEKNMILLKSSENWAHQSVHNKKAKLPFKHRQTQLASVTFRQWPGNVRQRFAFVSFCSKGTYFVSSRVAEE